MKFEGEHKVVPIKGIARAGADSMCETGVMNEVIGLEYKDGSFVPYKGTKQENITKLHENVSQIYTHRASSGNNVLYVTEAQYSSLFWLPEPDFNDGQFHEWNRILSLYIKEEGRITNIDMLKNIIIVTIGDKATRYFKFDGDEYSEINVHEIYEDLPIVTPFVTNKKSVKINDAERGTLLCVRQSSATDGQSNTVIQNVYRKGIAKLNEIGRLHGYFLAVVAYKLHSGEYICLSAPVLMCPPNDAVGKEDNYKLDFDMSQYMYTSSLVDFITGTGKQLQMSSKESFESFFEASSDYASAAKTGYRFHKHPSSEVATYDKDISTCDNMPPLWGYRLLVSGYGTSYSWYKYAVLSFASNTLHIKIAEDIKQKYSTLIDSCCVFITDQVAEYSISEDSMHQGIAMKAYTSNGETTGDMFSYYFDRREEKDIMDDIKKLKGFYLVHEVPFNEIKEGVVDVNLEGKLGDNLFTNTILPISAFVNRKVYDGNSYVYNSRNHMYNYKEELYYGCHLETLALGKDDKGTDGIGESQRYDKDTETERIYTVIAVIDSATDGKSIVVSKPVTLKASAFNRYFTYPDANAVKVYLLNNDTGKMMKFEMNASKSGGYSYCLVDKYAVLLDDFVEGETPSEYNTIINQSNNIKISDTFFAYTFPNQNVATIGNGNIIGLSTISNVLSQDTFGTFPLLVFCTDGIYSMEVDTSGERAYTKIAPFSPEVCINPNSICMIDGAVLFASDKGLMAATSKGVIEFLHDLNGETKHIPMSDNSKGLGLKLYNDIVTHENIAQFDGCIEKADFIDYVSDKDTHVTYSSANNKIVIYNKNKEYIYWIDIPTRITTKLKANIKFDNKDFPETLFIKGDMSAFKFERTYPMSDTGTMFQTRPIKLGMGLSCSYRIVVRGYFKSIHKKKWAELLVLGSYDGINWQPIGIREKNLHEGFNDIGCDTDRVSYKYMMIIFSATLDNDSHIDGIEMTVNNKYNNKLK